MRTLVLLLLLTAPLWAEDWTVAGKDYHNVIVGQVEADKVHITYDDGIGTIKLADLPSDLQKRFNYDPVAAAKATADEQAKEAASDAMVAQVKAQDKAAEQQEQKDEETAALMEKTKLTVNATITQVLDGGALVDYSGSGQLQPYGHFAEPIVIAGLSSALVDGDPWKGVIYFAGTYSYTTVDGAAKTVRRWATTKELALKLLSEK
jgi:hypothetical protein